MKKNINWNNISITELKNIRYNKDTNGITPLHYLAYHNSDENTIDYAFNKMTDINIRDNYGRTPLHFSLMGANNLSIMKKIIQLGGDINLRDAEGNQAIHFAAVYMKNEKLIKEIINKGGDVNKKNSKGYNPLHLGCMNNSNLSVEILEALLKSSKNINELTENNYNALTLALESNKSDEILSMLIDSGIDVNQKNNDDMVALHFAAALREKTEVFFKLVAAGANITVENSNGDTPLHFIAAHNKTTEALKIIDLYHEKNIDMNIVNHDQRTPLHHACYINKNYKMIDKIIKCGGDINRWDKKGISPLYYMEKNNERVYKKIIPLHLHAIPIDKVLETKPVYDSLIEKEDVIN